MYHAEGPDILLGLFAFKNSVQEALNTPLILNDQSSVANI